MSTYLIGVGRADVTDSAIGNGMQGMADPNQKIAGVETPLYARAFMVMDPSSGAAVAILNADIWAASAALKTEVLNRLEKDSPGVFTDANVLISGTHTHSGPGGFTDWHLYEYTPKGFDPHTVECIVHGMVTAIQQAQRTLGPGKIFVKKGQVQECGRQRSAPAYRANEDRKNYKRTDAKGREVDADTDDEMLLLKFVHTSERVEKPLGVLTWYAIHPTARGQKNTMITGDNKGHASQLFERDMAENEALPGFVAAFANSSCGDVSGNVDDSGHGHPPDGKADKDLMEMQGLQQYTVAKKLFKAANTADDELEGPIAFIHTRSRMSAIEIDGINITWKKGNAEVREKARTWPAALGLSFAAGSTEDSTTPYPPQIEEGLKEPLGLNVLTSVAFETVLSSFVVFEIPKADDDLRVRHHPKPIILAPGKASPPLTPEVLPLQILRIGQLAVVAIPAEITTMAGRRLTRTVFEKMFAKHIALATYANEYSQYITTKEEYDMQHYEGASTLFGPYTLMAYQKEFGRLAEALHAGTQQQFPAGEKPTARSAQVKKRVTFRNMSHNTVTVHVYDQSDRVAGAFFSRSRAKLVIPGHADHLCVLGDDKAKCSVNEAGWVEQIQEGHLVLVDDNSGFITSYDPPAVPDRLHKARSAVALRHADGTLHVFYASLAPGFPIYQAGQMRGDGTWASPGRAFSPANPETNASHGLARQMAIVQRADGRWQMFYISLNHEIWTIGQDETGGFGLHGTLGVPDATCLAVGRSAGGGLVLIYADKDKKIRQTWQGDGGWVKHQHFGGEAKAMAMERNKNGQLTLIYVGMDDHIYEVQQNQPGGAWGGHQQSKVEARDLTLWRSANDRLTLAYARKSDGRICVVSQPAINQALGWNAWGSASELDGWAKDMTCVLNAANLPELFYIGRDDRIYHTAQQSDGKWSAHRSLTEMVRQPIPAPASVGM